MGIAARTVSAMTGPNTEGIRVLYENAVERHHWGHEVIREGLYPIERDLFERFLPKPPARLLDLGSGGGREAIPLARMGYEVLGIDLSPKLVEIARRNAAAFADRARFETGDITRIDLEAERFDAALMLAQLYGHIQGRRHRIDTLRRVRRALVPGGVLILSTKDRLARFSSRAIFSVLNPAIRLTGLLDLEPNDLPVVFRGGRIDMPASIRERAIFHWHDARGFVEEAREAGFAIEHAVNVAGTGLAGEDHLLGVGDLFFVCRNSPPGGSSGEKPLHVERARRPSRSG